jgi:hypothetical protein
MFAAAPTISGSAGRAGNVRILARAGQARVPRKWRMHSRRGCFFSSDLIATRDVSVVSEWKNIAVFASVYPGHLSNDCRSIGDSVQCV